VAVHPDVTLVILAGGRATRMGGAPKPLMRLGGRTFVDRLLDLRPVVGGALIVANDPSGYAEYRVPVIPDVFAGRGPTAGLHAALTTVTTEWVLLTGGDMPFVHEAALDLLADARHPDDAWVCFEREGRFEPLPALYRKTLLPTLERRLSAGEPSFRDIVAAAPGRRLTAEATLGRVDPYLRALRGVNTPEEAKEVGAELPGGARSTP